MKFEVQMSAQFSAADIKAAVGEVCRQRLARQFPGVTFDGDLHVECGYGYLPELKVTYVPKKESGVPAPAEVSTPACPEAAPATAELAEAL